MAVGVASDTHPPDGRLSGVASAQQIMGDTATGENACCVITSIEPGTFLGIMPGSLRNGDGTMKDAVLGPDRFWLDIEAEKGSEVV